MSDKPRDQLDPVDRALRAAYPVGPGLEGVQVTIRKICGFELFNTRPYHNYETWSDGYEVTDGEITVRSEDLDDAVARLVACHTTHENDMLAGRPFCPRCHTFLDEPAKEPADA